MEGGKKGRESVAKQQTILSKKSLSSNVMLTHESVPPITARDEFDPNLGGGGAPFLPTQEKKKKQKQ